MKKSKRILAWTGIIILAGLYLSTIILAIIGTEASLTLLKASVLCTLGFPCLIYGYQLVYRVFKKHEEETDASSKDNQGTSIRAVIEKTKNR